MRPIERHPFPRAFRECSFVSVHSLPESLGAFSPSVLPSTERIPRLFLRRGPIERDMFTLSFLKGLPVCGCGFLQTRRA